MDETEHFTSADNKAKSRAREADVEKVYTLVDTMTRDRAVLIGDAAIQCYPTLAQGGGFSIEDAAALEVLFEGVTDPRGILKRLQLFQDVRLSRCAVVHIMSNNFVTTPDKVDCKEVLQWAAASCRYQTICGGVS